MSIHEQQLLKEKYYGEAVRYMDNAREYLNVIFEPDEDFYKSITMEEVRERLHKVIDKLYAKQ